MSFSEIASFEADIAFFAKRHDPDTRQWFLNDFDKWFHDPGDSRAYVLLGDPGVGKSVMAAVLAHRMRKSEHLGAAYFCRHDYGTRNDPRYLIGTVACQLCESNRQYNTFVGGEGGVRNVLSNCTLGVKELFTKLLQEPLGKCNPNRQRKVVIIDALDETKYESREDFLDLIMHRFPLLPNWLVFFITSRPEDSVQFRLKKYNPCVKICAGHDTDHHNFYQQHEQDIQTFLKKRIDYSRLFCTVEDISRKCHGLFLYAHYIVEEIRVSVDSGKKLNQLSDLFPGNIDDFFLQNFKRVYDQVGQDLFKKLFGCAVVAPSPLPVSIISYILKREKVNHDEQQVIDAVSQFVVLRTSDQTLTFLHNLIPAWLTDKNKASRKLFIDKKIAAKYLRNIFVEILPSVVELQPTCPSIDDKLKDYVSHVVVRFLCQCGEADSVNAVFSCLTSYHFIERRMLSGRIEIYHLLEDLKLAARQLSSEDLKKHEILQEIVNAIESNILVLLECPHLLHSCLRNASKTVQEAVLIPQVSVPWLEWNVYGFPNLKIADMQCFATSPNKKTVAGAKGRSIAFFDASTAETVSGPFKVSNDVIDDIDQLEFSPDGKFLFFGRLDKWFSVERGCVEVFPQFSGNSRIYKWGVFTRDGQSIVVERGFLTNPGTCQSKCCLFNVLALWALREIKESRSGETTVDFCTQGLICEPGKQIKCLLDRLGIGTILSQRRENPDRYDPPCHYCCKLKESTESGEESSLASIRQLVVELYPFIFNHQVWDLQTGMPLLQQVFSRDAQLNPFTYLCHVTCAFSECGLKMGCSGIENAVSVCNIAAVTAVCCCLFGSFYFRCSLEVMWNLERKLMPVQPKWERQEFLWLQEVKQELVCKMKCVQEPERMGKLEQELEWVHKLEVEVAREWELLHAARRIVSRPAASALEEDIMTTLSLHWKKLRKARKLKRLEPAALFKEFHDEEFKFSVCTNIPKGFQDFIFDPVNEDTFTCLSPGSKWVIDVGDSLKIRLLERGNQYRHAGMPEYTISKITSFAFTNDDLYFVYSSEDSLHALSFQTGAVLTSVSGCNPYFFKRERQVGYFFRGDSEERAIFLSNLFSPFKFLSVLPVKPSAVGKSIAASFCSSDTVMSVSSNSVVTLWKTTDNGEAIAFLYKSMLTTSGSQAVHAEKCALSPDGKLIAVHQENNVKLYSFAESGVELLHLIFESKCEFMVAYFAFSADSTVLFFCIQDRSNSNFYAWDIQNEVFSASFQSPGFLSAECCCFSLNLNKRELILCGEYEIEIWEYAEHKCRLITRLSVEKPYNFVEFSQCTVSLDNQLLVCCFADLILVYKIFASDINASKRVLRGHLGRIEFCRFLKVNRYLISYGVDGMVFLWDLTESKAVGFARVAQDQDSIVSMAVSPEEDIAVCFISCGRVCVIKLCELGSSLPLKALVETRLQLPEQIASPSQTFASCIEDDMFELESLSSSDSEEDIEYYDSE